MSTPTTPITHLYTSFRDSSPIVQPRTTEIFIIRWINYLFSCISCIFSSHTNQNSADSRTLEERSITQLSNTNSSSVQVLPPPPAPVLPPPPAQALPIHQRIQNGELMPVLVILNRSAIPIVDVLTTPTVEKHPQFDSLGRDPWTDPAYQNY